MKNDLDRRVHARTHARANAFTQLQAKSHTHLQKPIIKLTHHDRETLTDTCTVFRVEMQKHKHLKHSGHNCPLWETDSWSGRAGVQPGRVN